MEKVISQHMEEYGCNPEVVVSAPGRFHLLGEHSWYFKDKTLSMAVNLPVFVAISFRTDTALRFYFPQSKERKRSNIATLKYRKEDRWANSIKAMIFGYSTFGYSFPGMNITVSSEILPSAGFGINTAIKVAFALALRKLYSLNSSDDEVLKVIERGNKLFLNVGNYSSDIYTAMFAQEDSCVLTNHEDNSFSIQKFPFDDVSIILTDARVPRISVWNEESLRTTENLQLLKNLYDMKNGIRFYSEADADVSDVFSSVNEDVRRRLICIMKEYQNVQDAVESLRTNNYSQFIKIINKSHEIMSDLYLISCPEIDWLTKRVQEFDSLPARQPSSCSRITGKGFGRCTYTIIKKQDVESYMAKLVEYERIFGFHPSSYIVKPMAGATISQDNCT